MGLPSTPGVIRPRARWPLWVLVFLLTVESAARIEDRVQWGAPLTGVYSEDALLRPDSLVVRGRPDFRFQKWSMNSLGFRGPEVAPRAPEGRLRIATLGASETFGLFESEGHEYPAQLQRVLDSIAPARFEVVNVALPGMSAAAMVPYLEVAVAPIRPDVVLVYPSPSFYLSDDAPPETQPLPRRAAPPDDGRPALGWPRSRAIERTKLLAKRVVPPELFAAHYAWRLRRARAALPEGALWQEVPTDRMAQLDRQVRRVVDAIRAIGAEPVLITHVNRFLGRTDDLTAEDRRHLLGVTANYYPRATAAVIADVDLAANAVLRRIAADEGTRLIDLAATMAAEPTLFADYAHFTDLGAQRVAHVLGTALVSPAGGTPDAR